MSTDQAHISPTNQDTVIATLTCPRCQRAYQRTVSFDYPLGMLVLEMCQTCTAEVGETVTIIGPLTRRYPDQTSP